MAERAAEAPACGSTTRHMNNGYQSVVISAEGPAVVVRARARRQRHGDVLQQHGQLQLPPAQHKRGAARVGEVVGRAGVAWMRAPIETVI